MPHLGGNAIPKPAIRHLFRNFDNPARLAGNPIVRHLFVDPATGCIEPARAQTALGEFRQLVLDGLEMARRTDIERDRDTCAQRQHTIVSKTLLERKALADTARSLGISMRQAYRERAEIYLRIATFIWERRSEPKLPGIEGFDIKEFEIERARAIADLGNTAQAVEILERILYECNSAMERAEISVTLSELAVSCGDCAVAQAKLTLANTFLSDAGADLPRNSADLVSGRCALVTAKLLRIEGSIDRARAALASAREVASRSTMKVQAIRFSTEVALEHAAMLCDYGAFQPALDVIDTATEVIRKSGHALLRLRAALQTFRADYALMCPKTSEAEGNHRCLETLHEALELAQALSCPWVSLLAMNRIAGYHAYSGNLTKAYDTTRRVVNVAKMFPNRRVRSISLIESADVLAALGRRTEALQLVNEVDDFPIIGSSERALVYTIKALSLASLGMYGEANLVSVACEAEALKLKNHRLLGGIWRTMSVIAYKLGRMGEANERIRAAITEIESAGAPLSLVHAYRTAALITGDTRWRRSASVLARELSA